MRVYNIPIQNLEELESRIFKINKAAKKLNRPQVQTIFNGSKTIKINKRDVKVYCFSFTGESPKLAGWSFVGKIEHTEAGNLLRSFKGENIPESYRKADCFCDHCETKRKRNETYIVRNDDGRLFQVGKNCLRDFLGHSDVNNIFAVAELLMEISSLEEPVERDRVVFVSETVEFLSFCFMSIRLNGYHSKSGFSDPTSSRVVQLLAQTKIEEFPSKEDKDNAYEAIDWIKHRECESTIEENLQIVAQLPYIKMKHTGFAAYLAASYLKYHGQEIYRKKEIKEDKGYFGEVGSRYELSLLVVRETVIDVNSQFSSECYIYKMVDDDGREFALFSPRKRLNTGDRAFMKATVTKHSAYEGRSQTTINRPKLIKVESK